MPAEHQVQSRPQKQEPRREERRTPAAQSTPPARQMPPQQASAPPDRTARPPIFANLPPEKLKGQVRPMTPAGGPMQQSVEGEPVELQMPTPPSMELVEQAAPLELPAVVDRAALEACACAS